MSIKCEYCGCLVPDGTKVCPHCNAAVTAAPKTDTAARPSGQKPAQTANPAQQTYRPQTPNSAQQTYRPQTPNTQYTGTYTPAQNIKNTANAKPAKKSKRGLALFLVLAMLFTGFIYPGFLKKPLGDFIDGFNEGFRGNTDAALVFGTADDWPDFYDDDEETDTYRGRVSDICVSYTKKQLEDAPVYSQAVSPENTTADLGNVSVDFDRWNIDEDDTVTVTELPEVEDAATGGALKAYDFKLASGTHEFPTVVTVKIPVTTAEDEYGYCVHYDADKGVWEQLPCEESEDGKYYCVYTDSFSPIAERKFKIEIDDGNKATVLNSGIEGIMFNEYRSGYAPDRMSYPVEFDFKRFWGMVNTQEMLSDAEIDEITRKARLEDKGATLGMYSDLNGAGGAMLDTATAAGAQATKLTTGFGFTGYALNIYLTYLKIENDMKKDNKGFLSTAMQHKLDLLSVAVGTVGLFAGGSLGIAVAGLSIYGLSMANSAYESLVDSRPIAQRAYEAYYDDHYLYFSEEGYKKADRKLFKPKAFYMERPEAIDEEMYAKIAKITDQYDKPCMLRGRDFEKALGKLYDEYRLKFYEDGIRPENEVQKNPMELVEAVKGWYYSYANAFWEQDSQVIYKYMKEYCEKNGYDFNNDFQWPMADEEQAFIDEYVGHMMYEDRDFLKKLYETARTKSQKELMAYIDNTLQPLLNKKVVFQADDNASLTPYRVSYKSVSTNIGIDKTDSWCSKLELPIKFKGVDGGAVFTPGTKNYKREWSSVKKEKYYPYTDNFIPSAENGSNIIYTCNLYHYIMMGAPEYMTFHDVTGAFPDQDVEIEFPDTVSERDNIVVVLHVDKNEVKNNTAAVALTVKEDTVKSIFKVNDTVLDALYTSPVSVQIGADLSVDITVPGCSNGSFKDKYFHEGEFYSFSLSEFSFHASPDKGANETLYKYGYFECTANVSGTSLSYDSKHYEKSKARSHTTGTVNLEGKARVTVYKEGNKIEVDINVPYTIVGKDYYYSISDSGSNSYDNRNISGELHITASN